MSEAKKSPESLAKRSYIERRAHEGSRFIASMSEVDAGHNRPLWEALDAQAQFYVRRTLFRLPPGCDQIKELRASLADELDLLVRCVDSREPSKSQGLLIELQADAVCKAWRREKLLTAEDVLARAREKSKEHWEQYETGNEGAAAYNSAAGDALDELIFWAEERMKGGES